MSPTVILMGCSDPRYLTFGMEVGSPNNVTTLLLYNVA